jgi:hypothetical protein
MRAHAGKQFNGPSRFTSSSTVSPSMNSHAAVPKLDVFPLVVLKKLVVLEGIQIRAHP